MARSGKTPPATGCDRCGRRFEGTRTVVEDHHEAVVRLRLLCPDCYRAFLSTRDGGTIRVIKDGDERRVVRDHRTPAPATARGGPGRDPAGVPWSASTG